MVITQVLVATKTICDTGRASLGNPRNFVTHVYQFNRPSILRLLVCVLKGGRSKLVTNSVALYPNFFREKIESVMPQQRFSSYKFVLVPIDDELTRGS